MRRADPTALGMAGVAALLLAAAVFACWHGHPQVAPADRGGAWATRGCISPATAAATDWRVLPGVTRKLSGALAVACRQTDCTRQVPVLPGIGPVLRSRIARSVCRMPSGQ